MTTEFQSLSVSDFSQSETNLSCEGEHFITLSAPVTLQWEVTPWCNEKCVHCYNYWRQDQNIRPTPSADTIATWEKTATEIINNKVFHITATGGEPLAVFKQVYPVLKKLTENGVDIGINSNLTMLTKEKAQALKKIGIKSILTSLSSGDPELNDLIAGRKNTHRNISRGINTALNEGLWVAVNMVVTKKNLHDVYKTAEYVKDLGVKNFSATKASAPIRDIDFSDYALSKEEFSYMLEELTRVKNELHLSVDSLEFYPSCAFHSQQQVDIFGGRMCNAGRTSCTIGFEGSIRPCSHAVQQYGSVMDTGGLNSGWQKLQPWRTTSEFLPEKCTDCKAKTVCRGGCRTEAYVTCGSLKGEDPYSNLPNPTITKTPTIPPNVTNNDIFSFNPNVKSRPENFGAILFSSPVKWVPVDSLLYNLYQKPRSKFCLEDLGSALGVGSGAVIATAQVLLQKNIIERR